MQHLRFLGGAGIVTGSKYLLEAGEPVAADALRLAIEEQLGWRTHVPEHLERAALENTEPAHGESA